MASSAARVAKRRVSGISERGTGVLSSSLKILYRRLPWRSVIFVDAFGVKFERFVMGGREERIK